MLNQGDYMSLSVREQVALLESAQISGRNMHIGDATSCIEMKKEGLKEALPTVMESLHCVVHHNCWHWYFKTHYAIVRSVDRIKKITFT